ncbi:saccharopine dehydrogenase NADP-binding domain-containing protein [Halomonas sp. AOP42-C2-23]|uniref:saccharopine dehydrogenase NADP-binding domain-containing protein n=1 Tax=Halomonas TaxID=2745 RepID=UPI000BB6DB99|nr:saccharopine dehydrogenase NADP-binding domain-containing protein [Halomonas sp. JB37]PCC21599.1 hypothetical protein CIK78_05670 [Halomonas sp. JB37]
MTASDRVFVSTPRILVIGGTGETGRRILQSLHAHHPDWPLTCASRSGGLPADLPASIHEAALDVHDAEALHAVLTHHDLIVLAAGPMDVLGACVHEACLEVGVDCVDINDSLSAADAIFALHAKAEARHCRLLTGMGLTPGLSGWLLMKLIGEKASAKGVYRSRFYAGAAYGGGMASPHILLDSFAPTQTQWCDGQRVTQRSPRSDAHCLFHFPGKPKALPLFPYSAPEIAGLSASRPRGGKRDQVTDSWDGAVRTLDYRYHIQFLTPRMASVFGRLDRVRGMRRCLTSMFYKSGQSMKHRKQADHDCSLWVYPDDRPEAGWVLHGEISSYDFTALSACAAVEALLEADVKIPPGVYGMEQLPEKALASVEASLRGYGISARRGDDLERPDDPLPFGWCSVVNGEVQALRHYGQCWYDIEPHPRMKSLQVSYLKQSAIWAALQASLSKSAFAGFVARFLWRWQRHHAGLKEYRRQYLDQAGTWARITRDVSMFTAGYSLARDVLGQEKALAGYRRMFAETGRMEMRWLWPSPEVIAVVEAPREAVWHYWSAFVERYRALGLLQAQVTDNSLDIQQCAFAEMFTHLGCPELTSLMRDMEREALEHLGSLVDVRIDWQAGDDGQARVRVIDANPQRSDVRVLSSSRKGIQI